MENMTEITSKFNKRVLLVPQYVVDGEIKIMRYHVMLRTKIREFVSMTTCKILDKMIDST